MDVKWAGIVIYKISRQLADLDLLLGIKIHFFTFFFDIIILSRNYNLLHILHIVSLRDLKNLPSNDLL